MALSTLALRRCRACEGTTKPLSRRAAQGLLARLHGWKIIKHVAIRKSLSCKDFLDAVRHIQQIASCAEAEGHHPDLHLSGYRNLTIELSTHAIGGLSENDFILAAKIDQLLS